MLQDCVKKVAQDERLQSGDLEDLRRVVLRAEALFYEKFLALRGDEPEFQAERGWAYDRLGFVTWELGSWDEASSTTRRPAPSSPGWSAPIPVP